MIALDQLGIGLCGVAAVYLSQDTRVSRQRFSCLFGLAAQPFWFYTTWKAQQWGIFAVSFLYTASWARGFVKHWMWSPE
ncbi:hypothetical protein [Paraburkholderia kururiensis]|uniref:hypothetical protein n=1 Tax=Paraburkholderia kururiensis TaxID=984307 RepID=UPI00034C5B99|nr:hypothetical protein [Paraburkholderia kururiensis]